jgi:hypothetical protein
MTGRYFIIGVAICLWHAVAYDGQPEQVRLYPGPVAAAPSPSAISTLRISPPAKSLPKRSPAAPASQVSPGDVETSPGLAVSKRPPLVRSRDLQGAIAISVSATSDYYFPCSGGIRRCASWGWC